MKSYALIFVLLVASAFADTNATVTVSPCDKNCPATCVNCVMCEGRLKDKTKPALNYCAPDCDLMILKDGEVYPVKTTGTCPTPNVDVGTGGKSCEEDGGIYCSVFCVKGEAAKNGCPDLDTPKDIDDNSEPDAASRVAVTCGILAAVAFAVGI